jgi:hypothetical protein
MPHPSSHRSQKENSTVEPKVGDLVNIVYQGVSPRGLGYISKIENKFDQFDYSVYLFDNQREFRFRRQDLEIV